jgi:2-oxoglutarate ferredoxin oxidoreductase subunit beta
MIEHLHPNDDYIRKLPLFCPGCGNGIILHALIRSIKKFNKSREKLDTSKNKIDNPLDGYVFMSGIGCSGWIASPHLDADTFHTTHGRSVAVATGVKISNPDLKVVVISGDGDLASIGGNHLIHAARRNIELMVILVNNFIYGMTGGQSGPTTFHDAKTSTTPYGNFEYPFKVAELVATAGAAYSARWTVRHVAQLEKSIGKALEYSETGFAFVEVLSPCTTQFERRNYGTEDPQILFDFFKNNSVLQKDAKHHSEEDLKNKIVLGTFVEREVIGLTNNIQRSISRAQFGGHNIREGT